MCENGGMRLSAAQTASDTFAAVAPETRTVPFSSKRLIREWETLEAMIRIHCRDHHGAKAALCEECQELLDYAGVRLERCRFGAEKPTCAKCPVHCYQPARREQVQGGDASRRAAHDVGASRQELAPLAGRVPKGAGMTEFGRKPPAAEIS